MDRVLSLSCAPTLPLHPSHTPPLCCSAGRNATSSPPARAAPSPEGTETRLDTTARRATIALRLRNRGAVIHYLVDQGSVLASPFPGPEANSVALCVVREITEPPTSGATSRSHDVCRS